MSLAITAQTEAKYDAIKELQNAHIDATITVGAENTNVINVAVQLKEDKSGKSIAHRRNLLAYLSGVNTGASVVATAPTGGVAIGTNGGVIAAIVAGKVLNITTDAQGRFDLNLTDTGTPTFYLVVVMPNGRLVVSSAITFA